MTLSETRQALEALDLRPSKALGQNFLVDPAVAEAIVEHARIGPEDCVVEVGPGLGALSEPLAKRARKVILIEKDTRLAGFLRERFAGQPKLEVIAGDALEFDPRPLFVERPIKFIGNLPYSCGGEIIRHFLTPPHPFNEAVIMLQEEVAERLSAFPRTKPYGAFTLLTTAHWRPTLVESLSAEPFYPRPEVRSAVLRLESWPRNHWPAFDHRLFRRLVRQGFSQRRKQLKNLLGAIGCDWPSHQQSLGFSPTARAEELSLADWIALTNATDDHPLKGNPQRGDEIFDVVNEQDEVIGQATRREVHAKGLPHRAIHLFLFNSRGELFLQKRSWLKDAHPGDWDSSAAGHLDAGESYESAAIRELEEELGLRDCPVLFIGELPASEKTGWEFCSLYRSQSDGQIRFPCSEIETGQFFPLSVLEDWIARRPEDFAGGFLECYKLFREIGDQPGVS